MQRRFLPKIYYLLLNLIQVKQKWSQKDIPNKAEKLCTAFQKSLESTKEQLMDIKYLEALIINLEDKVRSWVFFQNKTYHLVQSLKITRFLH